MKNYTKIRKRNGPPADAPWIWLTSEMMEHPAFRALSGNAMKALFRILVEHTAHAGTENGQLVVTKTDLESYGIRGPSVSPAIKELEAMGWIDVERRRAGDGTREANRFRLTFLPLPDGAPATNRWKGISEEQISAYQSRLKANRSRKRKKGRGSLSVVSGDRQHAA